MGASVGASLGTTVGDGEGLCVGLGVGAADGSSEGAKDGTAVGGSVGLDDGECVGEKVGAGVAAHRTRCTVTRLIAWTFLSMGTERVQWWSDLITWTCKYGQREVSQSQRPAQPGLA